MEEQGSGKVHEKVNYLKEVEDTIDSEAHLPHLPFDIVKLIAKRLFLVDYLHFRATCKMLHSAIASPPIQWRIEAQRLENPALSPWLVLFGKESGYSFVDPKHGDKYHIYLPQAIKESSIICSSKDGWQISSEFGTLAFSSTPSSSECVVVEIEQGCNKPKFVVHFCSPGDDYWDECEGDDTNFLFGCNSPVFYKEAFYFLGREGNLGILKLNDEEPSFKVLTKRKRW